MHAYIKDMPLYTKIPGPEAPNTHLGIPSFHVSFLEHFGKAPWPGDTTCNLKGLRCGSCDIHLIKAGQ